MHIKVLGPGCAKCHKLLELTKKVVADLKVDATFEKVDKMDEFLKYKIFMTPALIIDEKVIFSGKVPSEKELSQIITKAATKNE